MRPHQRPRLTPPRPHAPTRCEATGTPLVCIGVQFVVIGLLVSLDFNQILCIDNFFSASAAALEFVACLYLRYSQPDLVRPYRIPVGGRMLCAMLLVPIAISLFVCYATFVESIESMIVISIGLVVGILIYLPFCRYGQDEMSVETLSRAASLVTQSPLQGALLKHGSHITPLTL